MNQAKATQVILDIVAGFDKQELRQRFLDYKFKFEQNGS